jgi:hypothetical protein
VALTSCTDLSAADWLVASRLSWWWDHDARKRGATPLSGGAMQRARWSRNLDNERQLNSVVTKGATPRTQDAAQDAWKGKTDH